MRKIINIPDDLLADLEELAAEVSVPVKQAMENIIINTLRRWKKEKGFRHKTIRLSGRSSFVIYHTVQDDTTLEKLIDEWISGINEGVHDHNRHSLINLIESKGYRAMDEMNFRIFISDISF